MPINVVRDGQGRKRFEFEFSRRIEGRRFRKRRLLPAGYTRAQADAYDRKESAALHAIAEGTAKPRRTVDEAVASYQRERLPELKHGAGLKRELDATKDWWTGRSIDELPAICAEYAADQHGALAPATIMNRIAYLRSACRWAWKRHNMADSDPGARVVTPTVRNKRKVYLSREQVLQLARACGCRNENQRLTRAMILVAFYTGWRFGEIRRATVDGDLLVLDDSKNGEARVLPIDRRIRRYVGRPWPIAETVHYWLRKARTKAKMPSVHFHTLRHSAASAIISNSGTLAEVGAVLGHKSVTSSHRYAHLLTDALEAAVSKIGKRA